MEQMRTPNEAVDRLISLYDQATARGIELLQHDTAEGYEQVVYPKLVIEVTEWRPIDRTEPFGYVDKPGRYAATLSRPRLMRAYLLEQLERLAGNYPCRIYVGPSDEQIPPEYIDDAPEVERSPSSRLPRPSLDAVDDAIIDGEWFAFHGPELPLFHFTAQRLTSPANVSSTTRGCPSIRCRNLSCSLTMRCTLRNSSVSVRQRVAGTPR